MIVSRELLAIARLDLADIVRSRWLVVSLGFYLALALMFVFVGMRESSVLGFTGAARVLFSLAHALLLVLPLLGLAVTAQVVNRARADGMLELLLSQPMRPGTYLAAVAATRVLALTIPLILTLSAVGVFGGLLSAQPIAWSLLLRCAVLCCVLLWASVALGMAISVHVPSPARAMTYVILAWALGVALLDFGLIGTLLSWRMEPRIVFALALANPVESVRIALLSAIEPELGTLGPVGFWVANRLGSDLALVAGLVWPLCFGAIAYGLAQRRFRRGDRV